MTKNKKMSRFIVLILLLTFGSILSQTNRFYYDLTIKFDSALYSKDLMVLEVGNEKNIFFSNEYLRVDSINNATKKFKFAYPNFNKIILWNKNDNSFDFKNRVSMNYYQFKKTVNIDWKLLDEKKKIGDFLAQKAVGSYGGRNWIAWFTNEIPLPYGPYVFYGLPGLILEVNDTENIYSFSFVQSKNINYTTNTESIIEQHLGKSKFLIKESEWKQVLLNYYNNPIPEYKNGTAMMLKDDGSQYTQNDYRDLEKSIQNQIKKYNNPIELSEKVEYH